MLQRRVEQWNAEIRGQGRLKDQGSFEKKAIRLESHEIDAIEQAARHHLTPGSRVLLFGSRLDARRRGGDIDLLIEPPIPLGPLELAERRNGFIAHLYRLLGERRIDVLIAPLGLADERPVVAVARRDGILLTEV